MDKTSANIVVSNRKRKICIGLEGELPLTLEYPLYGSLRVVGWLID